jgi:DivIVA domain-containing protein
MLSAQRGTIVPVIWLWVVFFVIVIGAAAVIIAGRDDELADVYDDRPDSTLPSGRGLTSDDLDQVRFSTGLRGYRMDEVDSFIARVKADLLARETVEAGEVAAEQARDEGTAADDGTSDQQRTDVSEQPADEPARPDDDDPRPP